MKPIRFCALLFAYALTVKFSYAYQLALEELKLSQPIPDHIIAITPVQKHSTKFLLAARTGELYLLDDNVTPYSLTTIFGGSAINSKLSHLVAITLHPNFSVREQSGYHTLYTAHLQHIDDKRIYRRITDKQVNQPITRDILISEWRLDEAMNLDTGSQREVMRIGLPAQATNHNERPAEAAVKVQLAFNPFHKVWHENFGHLYIGVSQLEGYNHIPLYSGAILRINPDKFGLNPYTVPQSNPFIADTSRADELIYYNLQHLQHFIWRRKTSDTLWIDHIVKSQRQISSLSDYRQLTEQSKPLIQLESTYASTPQLLHYRGDNFSYLTGQAITIAKYQGETYLANLAPSSSGFSRELSPLFPISSSPESAMLLNDGQGEMLIYQPNANKLYHVRNVAIEGETISYEQTDYSDNRINQYVLLVFAITLISWILWQSFSKIRYRKHSATTFYAQQYSHIELAGKDKIIQLFYRHQSTPKRNIASVDVKAIQLRLNGLDIVEFSCDQGMTNKQATIMREACNVEKREKMIPDKLRHIQLVILDKGSTESPITLYLRKGDNRISKASYQVAVADAINWAWRLSAIIAPETTEVRDFNNEPSELDKDRPIKVTMARFTPAPANQATAASEHFDEAELDTTAREVVNPKNHQESELATQIEMAEQISPSTSQTISSENKVVTGQTDAQIISALEKLVNLKKQNFLTDDEFEQAKAKLLKGLI
ncbi:SHOCT domain-containing protein [Thalassotalea euphylliae]|uniref:SHOCT domain-containing protein n=1 Tax=Thalassotalea euphylliae TaxID=1655234 RepID=A0A3E0TVX8_9GAMM|nr:SHOCT domain-containing protein [Thalassotalea euphylliae]REL28580.1 SHOCT domain-containing protein [Thalassotalea euphylliae]